MTAPHDLRVEHGGASLLGVGTATPRLSWRLPANGDGQTAYEIASNRGRVVAATDRSLLVAWPFAPLASRDRVTWRVRVRCGKEWSDWSAASEFEIGLLEPGDWRAAWIEPTEPTDRARFEPGRRPVYVLRHDFELDQPAPDARLYATAHGVYECFLNGRRVGDLELTPGFTSYDSRLQVQTYAVGDLLAAGTNRWEVLLSDGWFRGRHGNNQTADNFGDTVAFLAQLESGAMVITTGGNWRYGRGRHRTADLMAGQVDDLRVEPVRWSTPVIVEHGYTQLVSSPAPPVRAVEELRPAEIVRLDQQRQIVDFGQNVSGRVRLRHLGPSGTTVTLTHGEALDPLGDVTTAHLEPVGLPLGQVDTVTSRGVDADEFEPRHTVHGFQYVRVDGLPHHLHADDITAVVVHTDLPRTGWFSCSDERLNRLHHIADWSFRANACDIPTDCPHRERSGWTGDWQLFYPTAAFLYDVAGFTTKWLRDLAADQLDDGLVPNYAPEPRRRRAVAAQDITWYGLQGSAGWGDAIVIVPWLQYQLYGDDAILAELWPAAVKWVRFAARLAQQRRHASRVERNPTPLPHEEFLWDGGWHWGEWCEPEGTGGEPFWSADQGHVATAYLHLSTRLLSRIGTMLGHHSEAAELALLAERSLDAWRREYVRDDGSLAPDTQANHVRALAFGLVTPHERAAVAQRLVALVREAGNHLTTGFLATPHLLPVLVDAGHADAAFDLLLQDTPPSWLTMVERGATTIWEDWEGIDAAGNPHASLNHYSKGAVITFLHRYVAGIRPIEDEPAYRRFRIAPVPGGGITWARGAFESPYGRIESSWRIDGGHFVLDAVVPPGTTALVELPDGTVRMCGPGSLRATCSIADRS